MSAGERLFASYSCGHSCSRRPPSETHAARHKVDAETLLSSRRRHKKDSKILWLSSSVIINDDDYYTSSKVKLRKSHAASLIQISNSQSVSQSVSQSNQSVSSTPHFSARRWCTCHPDNKHVIFEKPQGDGSAADAVAERQHLLDAAERVRAAST